MPIHVRLDPQDPYETFSWFVGVSRLAMREIYARAFAVYGECVELMKERSWEVGRGDASFDPWTAQLQGWSARAFDEPPLPEEELNRLRSEAAMQDYHADYLAGVPLLFANNTIERFGRNVLQRPIKWDEPFGHDYGDHRGKAPYTAFVRAAANAVRHFGEWDDVDWTQKYGGGIIYPAFDDADDKDQQKLRSILVLQNALGLGIHERFRDVVSMKALLKIDQYEGGAESYDRFEARLIEAARDIAEAVGGDAPSKLAEQIEILQDIDY